MECKHFQVKPFVLVFHKFPLHLADTATRLGSGVCSPCGGGPRSAATPALGYGPTGVGLSLDGGELYPAKQHAYTDH